MNHLRLTRLVAVIALAPLALLACVNVDPETGEVIPRGTQRHTFEEVVDFAEDLDTGMTRAEVLLLLGSPAERSHRGEVWVYLPERPAVIVPGRALRLEFSQGILVKFAFHAIILGETL